MKPNAKRAGRNRQAASRGARAQAASVSSPPRARAGTPPDPRAPSTYPRRILLAVTGLSPQVVTETLYALAVKREPVWTPHEIHLVTTERGAANAQLKLLSDQPGWFNRLCGDYGLSGIRFDADCIHIIRREDGSLLDDIRDDADNRLAADYIAETVRALTADPACEVHASIAGGRKTMGFYLGYAMSLYGRIQDQLSHVLVSAPYESHPEFYYPTLETRVIETLDRAQDALDTSKARVWLGDIPFVRLREELPRELLEGRARFSEAVAEAQKALPPVALGFDPAGCILIAGGERIKLPLPDFVFYWMLAERRKAGRPGVHWSEKGLGAELLDYYRRLLKPYGGEFERAEKVCARFSKENFDPRKSHINDMLERVLGRRRAQPYLIVQQEKIPGTRYHRNGLSLPPDTIALSAASLASVREGGD